MERVSKFSTFSHTPLYSWLARGACNVCYVSLRYVRRIDLRGETDWCPVFFVFGFPSHVLPSPLLRLLPPRCNKLRCSTWGDSSVSRLMNGPTLYVFRLPEERSEMLIRPEFRDISGVVHTRVRRLLAFFLIRSVSLADTESQVHACTSCLQLSASVFESSFLRAFW